MARLAWFLAIICSLARVSCRIESVMCGDVKDEGGGLYRERGGRICHDGICVFLLCLRKRGG